MWRQEPARWKRHLFEWPLHALLLLAAAAGLAAYQVRVPQVVDVGGSHDAPYLTSFHDVEPDPLLFPDAAEYFRWTRAVVGLDFPGLGRQPVEVRLRMQAYRPTGEPAPEAGLWVGGHPIYSATVVPQWQEYRVLLPAQLLAAPRTGSEEGEGPRSRLAEDGCHAPAASHQGGSRPEPDDRDAPAAARLDRDRVLSKDIEAVAGLIRSGAVERAVAEAVGPLA